ncbi:hypothetical protein FQN60_013080 [Etheostoma spectabile]|uniref:Uncharacterized protein n=1 Tax=Etheostoma spectabile TaxID=54343 RepID=A0A5J5DAQ4_9PERO|nr:hypothetical protein FQN60_013080 [Etheostoma spectabile]
MDLLNVIAKKELFFLPQALLDFPNFHIYSCEPEVLLHPPHRLPSQSIPPALVSPQADS